MQHKLVCDFVNWWQGLKKQKQIKYQAITATFFCTDR